MRAGAGSSWLGAIGDHGEEPPVPQGSNLGKILGEGEQQPRAGTSHHVPSTTGIFVLYPGSPPRIPLGIKGDITDTPSWAAGVTEHL